MSNNRSQCRTDILNFLTRKGADVFWAETALSHIMLNLAGNNYWLTDISRPAAKINEFGMIDKFTCFCQINTVSKKAAGKLTYKHNTTHTVQVKAI